jgi:epoxyqueuosine reductase
MPSEALPFREQLSKHAREAGFDLAGIVSLPLSTGPESPEGYFEEWIAAGHAGEMEYLKRRDEDQRLVRSSLETAFPWARSIIVCAVNYNADAPYSTAPAPEGSGWIARYAWSGQLEEQGKTVPTDYHTVLLKRLRTLEATLQAWLGPIEMRSYVDTGPIVERSYAHAAGIGWTGKNTCIINQQRGSWLFLGVIVTTYELESDAQPAALAPDRCGSCRRCIEACPTDALIAPYQMDASRCIAYLTIEKRGPIPEPLRKGIGRQVFGCDICQDVCPWNRRAPIGADPALSARQELINPALSWLAELDAESFNRLFRNSPVKRTKINGLRRNVAIAMGNSHNRQFLPKLEEWAQADDAAVSDAAIWAKEQILSET